MSALFRSLSFVAAVAAVNAVAVYASDEKIYLDPPYPKHAPLILQNHFGQDHFTLFDFQPGTRAAPAKSDTNSLIARITPIRNQSARGTCSIFSATAMLEAMMVLEQGADNKTLDLSEEWLEYLITYNTGSDGSTSTRNFNAFKSYGDALETQMPYIGETWTSVSDSDLAQQRCGTLTDAALSECLVSHRNPALMTATDAALSDSTGNLYDPEFLAARKSANAFRDKYLTREASEYSVTDEATVKSLLAQGLPLTLDLEFYYGAWNHRGGAQFGLSRDMTAWADGIVGYPEEGSVDREKSPTTPEGHSVLLVGYDDAVTVTTHQLMTDGTTQTFTYTGVYYFKNSWGTDNFGPNTTIDGVVQPGYGVITQKYANEFGTFYQLPLK